MPLFKVIYETKAHTGVAIVIAKDELKAMAKVNSEDDVVEFIEVEKLTCPYGGTRVVFKELR